MSVSTIGAFVIGEYPEAVAVMLFYQVGEFFQSLAFERSRKSISDLMDIRPDCATAVSYTHLHFRVLMKLIKFAMRYGIMLIPFTFTLCYLKKKANL